MNKTSGFRTIEFKDQVCDYKDDGFTEIEYCYNGMIFLKKYNKFDRLTTIMTRNLCKKCDGTGTIDSVEVKIE